MESTRHNPARGIKRDMVEREVAEFNVLRVDDIIVRVRRPARPYGRDAR